MASRIFARLARKGGGKLLDMAIARVFPEPVKPAATAQAPDPSGPAPKGAMTTAPKGAMATAVAGAALTKIATRSIPGAIVAGGVLLAKRRYDRRHGKGGA